MAVKNFNQLKEEDFIYQLNPFTLQVEGMRVREVKGVTDELIRNHHPTPEIYKHFVKVIYYRRELVLHSPDLDKVPTVTLIVDGRVNNTLAYVKLDTESDQLYPVPFVTDKKMLETWMQRTK